MAGLGECLEALLELALAVHDRCAMSTAALLIMLETGTRLSEPPEGCCSLAWYALNQCLIAQTHAVLFGQVGLRASHLRLSQAMATVRKQRITARRPPLGRG